MDSFVAIDVETANYEPTSICSIAAVKVVDGYIVDRLYMFVKPEPNYYIRHFSQNIHGITKAETDDARPFCYVWPEFHQFIDGLPLVAHNKSFDERCIRAAHKTYGMDYPDYPFYCTVEAARRMISRRQCPSFSLPYVCEFLGIPFYNHHNALADAEACAKIAMALL